VSEEHAHAGAGGQRVRRPFPGSRPFGQSDARLFFGRSAQTRQLRSLWLTERTVVLAGPPAIGKTSLLLAGVLPALTEAGGADVLPVGRLTADQASSRHSDAVGRGSAETPGFVRTLLRSWGGGDVRLARAGATVLEFLADRAAKTAGPDVGRPLLAVIDQFEEAFATPAAVLERDRLLAQLAAAVAAVPDVHLLLVMRRDAVPLLAQHPQVADLGHRVLSLRPLAHDEAVQAVTGPADVAGVPLASGVAEQLVTGLAAIRSVDQAGREVVAYTDGVEPLYLQLTGRRLFAARAAADEVVTGDLVRAHGGVEDALADFYDSAVHEAAATAAVDEDALRGWIQRTFLTEAGARDSVQQGYLTTGGLPGAVVGRLAARWVITAEHRAGGLWYQLSDDRIAYAIRLSNDRRAERPEAGAAPGFDDRADPAQRLRATAEAALGSGDLAVAEQAGAPVAQEYKAAGDWRHAADARVLQAEIATALGKPGEAEWHLRAALSIFMTLEDPYSAGRILTAIAELRSGAGDYAAAADLNRQAVERMPGDAAALTGLAYAQWQDGSPADAEATFGQALRWNGNTALALAGRGQIRADLGRYEYALDDLDRALRLKLARDAEADARSARAVALAGLGRVAEAERELSATFQLDPDRARTRLRAGRMAAILGHWDEVRAEIERALSGQPSLSSVERESARRIMESIR
jgi:tetratricopeptide (TPR) repeat protein/adenine/guanine phosphoribosyltransferase-like PRPP-binding protein